MIKETNNRIDKIYSFDKDEIELKLKFLRDKFETQRELFDYYDFVELQTCVNRLINKEI